MVEASPGSGRTNGGSSCGGVTVNGAGRLATAGAGVFTFATGAFGFRESSKGLAFRTVAGWGDGADNVAETTGAGAEGTITAAGVAGRTNIGPAATGVDFSSWGFEAGMISGWAAFIETAGPVVNNAGGALGGTGTFTGVVEADGSGANGAEDFGTPTEGATGVASGGANGMAAGVCGRLAGASVGAGKDGAGVSFVIEAFCAVGWPVGA